MRIPIDSLQPDTLRRVIEEYVTRDGTDMAEADQKRRQVLRALQLGRAELHFDDETGTTTIIHKP